MKRTLLLNRHLSALIARLGHLDEIVVADAGLPMPDNVEVIDLAIIPGLPRFVDVLRALRTELIIESAVHASEAAPDLIDDMQKELDIWSRECDQKISFQGIPHQDFKRRSANAKAVIRTGEVIPYANIILISGVAF
ncbi:MAG: D-ribose pyranase [Sneathiella sp.]|uniref:D-ribose pyranase n=1 Tax=Sneathiella sp. TaxID=1964365 RepID=UPI003002A06B